MTPKKIFKIMLITLLVMGIIMLLASCNKVAIQVGEVKGHGTILVRVQAVSMDETSAAFSETSAYIY